MSILNSIFCGAEGSYNINNIQVNFTSNNGDVSDVFGRTWFGRSVETCLNNPIFRFLTFGYLHVFVHEMGHALAMRLQDPDAHPTVNVYTEKCQGDTSGGPGSTFTTLAGPLTGASLEIVKLVGAIALTILLPTPIGLPLGIFLGSGAAIWIFGELMYALSGQGDWANVRS